MKLVQSLEINMRIKLWNFNIYNTVTKLEKIEKVLEYVSHSGAYYRVSPAKNVL